MFSLVITTLSIALAAAVAVAALYFGGAAFTNAGPKAKAAQLTAETEQLRTAIQMYVVDHGKLPTKLDDLTDNGTYLRSPPDNWRSTSQFFTNEAYDVGRDTCLLFNRQRGIPFVPECTDEAYRNVTICCRNSLMSTE